MNTLLFKTCLLGISFGATMLAPVGIARSQASADQELAARRQAIVQREELITEDGQIVDQDEVVNLPPRPVAPSTVSASQPQLQIVYRPISWRGRYDARRYAGYNYGPPRGRFYARYPSYYDPYYGGYGYGYRGYYYGTPRFGYYDYPYGGAARVGPLRIYWR